MNSGETEKEVPVTEENEIEIDPVKLERYMQKKKSEQNLMMGIICGMVATLVGAGIWAAITVATEYQIGYMAIGVGFLVAMAVKIFGKGFDPIFGYAGGVLALFGCILGNFFTVIAFASVSNNIPALEFIKNLDIGLVINVMVESFQFMDILFYSLAGYFGYKFAINQLQEEDFAKLAEE